MRKHRLYGVVIAALLGMGAITQHPGASHHAVDTDFGRTGITLSSAAIAVEANHPSIAPTVRFKGFVLRGDSSSPNDAIVGLLRHVLPPPPPPPPPPAPEPPARPRPQPTPTGVLVTGTSVSGGVWAALRDCESGGNYADDTGNGYYGAYQFTAGTWHSLGFGGLPSEAAPALQDHAAQALQARSGWGQWPACSRALGLA